MKIAIIGGGSIGLLLTSFLKNTEAEVFLITRTKEQADVIRQQGIRVTDINGKEHLAQTDVFSIGELSHVPSVDWTFVTVKQAQTKEVISSLAQWSDFGNIVSFQNGMGHMELMSSRFASPLFSAITTEGAFRREVNHVVHAGSGMTWIGQWTANTSPRHLSLTHNSDLKWLVSILKRTGLQAEKDCNIKKRAWRKLLINCVINPVTALFEVKNGQLLQYPSLMVTMKQIFDEGKEAARLENIDIDDGLWEEIITVCRNTSNNHSSMLQDVQNKKKTEIDFMNHYLVECGAKNGRELKVNQLMVSFIHAREEMYS